MSFRPGDLLMDKQTKQILRVVDVEPWIGEKYGYNDVVVHLECPRSKHTEKYMGFFIKNRFIKTNMWTLLLYG